MSSSSGPDPAPPFPTETAPWTPDLPRSPAALSRRIAGKALPLYLSMLSTLVGSAVTAAVLGRTGTVELAAYALVVAVFNPMAMVVHGSRMTVLRGHRTGFGPPRWPEIGRIAKVGLPTGSTLLVKSGSLSVLAVLVARIGPEEAAVHQIAVVLLWTTFVSFVAVGQATVPFTVRAAKSRSRALVARWVSFIRMSRRVGGSPPTR